MKKILEEYIDKTCDSTNSRIREDFEDFELVKKYYNGDITFKKLIYEANSCPPNSCHWCKENCDICDIKCEEYNGRRYISEELYENPRCEECWRRCLNQEKEIIKTCSYEECTNFIGGRDDLAVTIFVPWDCQNNCKFCTSKKEYSKYELDIEKTKESIYRLNELGFDKFVFTGGEPFANLDKLKELISIIDKDKTVYINTTLPIKNIERTVDYINEENRIKSISVSRHSDKTVNLNNIATDKILGFIKKPVRINSLVDCNLNIMDMVDRFSVYNNVMLNLRVDYRFVTKDNLKIFDKITVGLNENKDYVMTYNGGCNVCHNFEFTRLSDGFRVQYHKGLELSSFVVRNTLVYNDLIVKPDGNIYYDWDNKNYNINLLLEK